MKKEEVVKSVLEHLSEIKLLKDSELTIDQMVSDYLKWFISKNHKRKKTMIFIEPAQEIKPELRRENEYDVLVDDSNWGNPLGSIMVGVYSFKHNKFINEVIDIKHCQSPNFENKTYLLEMANATLRIFTELQIEKTAKILVCRGFVNNTIPVLLSGHGYSNISRGVIGEPLQTMIEEEAHKYIDKIGFAQYYDPKGMKPSDIGRSFNATVKWIVDNNKFDICKSAWGYFKEKKYLSLK